MNVSDALPVTLRPYRLADAAATLTVFTEAITQTAAAHYTARQIEAWAQPGRRDLPSWNDGMSGRATVVAVAGDEVVGFSDVDGNGYIDMLFVSPRHLRRGIARTLLGFIEQRPGRRRRPSSPPMSASPLGPSSRASGSASSASSIR